MRRSPRTGRRLAIVAAAALLLALVMSACTPSAMKVEENVARSFARKVDKATGLTSNCTIIGSDSAKGSFLSECRVFGSGDYYLLVRVSTDYQAGTFSARDAYPRSAGGYLEQVDGAWTYRWAA